MNIKKIDVKYVKKSSLSSRVMDGVCHTKVLPWFSVAQATEGSYELQLADAPMQSTGTGGFFLAPPHVRQTILHRSDPESGFMRCRWIFFDVFLNDVYRIETLYDFPSVIPASRASALNALFDTFFTTKNVFERYACQYRILEELLRFAVPKKKPLDDHLKAALEYIFDHLDQQIRIETLAQTVHLSESRFYAAFKQVFGASPIAFINHCRLSAAAEQLVRTDRPIQEIAAGVGIEDPLYFSKLFKKSYQMSPRKYREVYLLKNE